MADPDDALRRIRKARASLPTPPPSRFEDRRDEYETALTAVHDLAGDDAADDLSGWIIVQASHDGALPTGREVLTRARSLLAARDVTVPGDSPLAVR